MPEESLLSARDSLTKTLERQPFRHHEPPIRGKELLSKIPKSTTSESCRDSSAFTKPQNDNKSQTSPSSETRSRLG